MLKNLSIWGLCAVALFAAIAFAKTSVELQEVRAAARVDALTYAARQDLQQALGDRELAREQANEAKQLAAALHREAKEVEEAVELRRKSAEEEIASINESVAILEQERTELAQSVDALNSHHAALMLARENEEEKLRQSRVELASMEREANEAVAAIARHRQDVGAREAAIEGQVTDLDAQRLQLEQTIALLRVEQASLTMDLQKASKQRDALIVENDNLAAALVARASNLEFELDRIPSETSESSAIPNSLEQAEQEGIDRSVDVDWAALGPIPFPPRRPDGLGLAQTPRVETTMPAQARRSIAAPATARVSSEPRAAPRSSGRTRAVGGSASASSMEPASLSLPSSLLPSSASAGAR
jgi:chromosome segregation ATPase